MKALAPHAWLIASGLLCAALFSATIPLPRVDGHLVGSDGLSYYAIVRSLALDGDFDFANDYRLLGVAGAASAPTGLLRNPFAIGAPLLWAPFFLAAHAASLALAALGLAVRTDGVGPIYEAAVCYATIAYATGGLVMAHAVARRVADGRAALAAALLIWWATPAIYYIVAEPSMSHGVTIFTVGLWLWAWHPPRPERPVWGWALLGAASGLAAIGRWQDGLLIAVPLAELGWWAARRRLAAGAAALRLLAFGGAAALLALPQLLMWRAVEGRWLTIPQGEGFFRWADPQLLATLFSTRHGLITWHPLFLLALLGLIPLWRRDRALALAALAAFLAQWYVNSAAAVWWADDAFGGRRFTSLVPLLCLGLAALLAALRPGRARALALGLGALLVAWNGLALLQYRLGLVDRDAALSWRELTVDRLLLPLRLLGAALGR